MQPNYLLIIIELQASDKLTYNNKMAIFWKLLWHQHHCLMELKNLLTTGNKPSANYVYCYIHTSLFMKTEFILIYSLFVCYIYTQTKYLFFIQLSR